MVEITRLSRASSLELDPLLGEDLVILWEGCVGCDDGGQCDMELGEIVLPSDGVLLL